MPTLRTKIREGLINGFDGLFAKYFNNRVSKYYSVPPHRPGEQPEGRYQICTRCIMDTTDPEITFDEHGVCNHCRSYDVNIGKYVKRGPEGWAEMEELANTIKAEGKGKRYDCIIGLSGGVDSTYVAYLVVKKLGLRPLAIHLDNGWNTEIAVRNIENVVNILGIDLYTEVLNWDEFRSLQAAFVRAGVPDCEIPTDHAITATLYRIAIENGVRFIMGGSNYATEQMVPRTWSDGHSDWRYIRTVAKKFSDKPLKTYPHYTFFDYAIYWPQIKRMEMVYLLNHIDYNKFEAIEIAKKELGWVSYGDKHHESLYTRFYQTQFLPRKFGADKRRPHLSCLINDHRMTRDEALAAIQKPPIDEELAKIDREFVLKKLGIKPEEYQQIMDKPPVTLWDYDTDMKWQPVYYLPILGMIMTVRDPKRLVRLVGGRAKGLAYRVKYRSYLTLKALLGRG
ncbi:MAG: N-acetyl sugar amidotransferase [Rhizomicrobium sp.]